MCGFVGFTDPAGGRETALDLAGRMLTDILHRGPDGTGTLHETGLTLAHCALRFVDVHGPGQPLRSASGRTVVVLNGEVYNHAELRRELVRGGARLRTAGDTEILAELYERTGMGFLRRLHGMFAFALYDRAHRKLILARDPFGKRPLYYLRTPAGVAFASELTPLLRHPACGGEPDVRALADYLVLRACPAPRSAVRHVAKVRAGSYVEASPGAGPDGFRETVYFTPGLPATRRRVPLRTAAAEFEDLLRAAVQRRVTGTPRRLGVLLSGGLDSSTVAALAQEISDRPVPAFTAGFADTAFDESSAAAAVARHLGLEHHLLRITEDDLAEAFTEEYTGIDEPLADPSLLPTLLLCRAAGQEVRSVLTGDGADEMLLGYRFFQAEKVLGLLGHLPRPLLEGLARSAARQGGPHRGNLPWRVALRRLAQGMNALPEQRFYAAGAPFRPDELAGVLSVRARHELVSHQPFEEVERVLAASPGLSPLERCQLGIITHFLRDVILTKTDRGGMRHALETRSPFLDRDLVEYCASLPAELKLRRLTAKYVLRRTAAGHLPPQAVRRRKLGFRAPVAALLSGRLRPVLMDALSPESLARHDLFEPSAVRRMVDDHLASRRDNSVRLWALLCFQSWHDAVLRPVRTVLPPVAAPSSGA
ncbi:asparagine synthase (glutamine-hydrolyzing) [Streptomyces sp. NPDC053048]|uniref:asparagine synthase (glutamine-hydrolyzing) n=1 Tax=Streptomyces sp. NPDC053048 TaxID=3365694 RepID=UPI0037D6C740